MITSEQVANIRRSLLSKVEIKVRNTKVFGIWNDIQLDTQTGLIDGIYVGEKLYRLGEIDYILVR